MSLADFYIENGLDPSDPNHVDQLCRLGGDYEYESTSDYDDYDDDDDDSAMVPTYSDSFGMHTSMVRYSLSDIPDPSSNEIWTLLCSDDRWKCRPIDEKDLFFCEIGEVDAGDYWGQNAELKAVPAPAGMHRGALAPRFVFETPATNMDEKTKNCLESYLRLLICAVSGRFVIIERVGASDYEKLTSTKGRPQSGVKYRWRYWDNEGNVYESLIEKSRWTVAADYRGYSKKDIDWKDLLEYGGNLPGDFRTNSKLPLWMRMGPGESTTTHMGEFWDCMWCWKHEGSIFCSEWNERLSSLAHMAGVPMYSISDNWKLKESELDIEAEANGWEKIECKQPAMASYRKGDNRLNFYLSTGTVGSCVDHPKKGKTQLFRKYLENPLSLFNNPRQHTGKGYYTKNDGGAESGHAKVEAEQYGMKRKASGEIHKRSCASCGKSKSIDDFSKNQRRKGAQSRCNSCVQA